MTRTEFLTLVHESDKIAARRAVTLAVRRGEMVRLASCEHCGESRVGLIHAHHRDYREPLNVLWLCSGCHHEDHQKLGWGTPDTYALHPLVGPLPQGKVPGRWRAEARRRAVVYGERVAAPGTLTRALRPHPRSEAA